MSAALIEAARAALDSWARDECVQFVSRSDGHRTTTTVSRDALLLLVTRALAAAEQPAEPVGLFDIRAIVQQAALALEELGGPGYLIGGVMHHRIGLILPKLNEAIDALAAAPAAPAQAPLTDEQLSALILATVYDGDERIPYRDYWTRDIGEPFARAIERAHGIGSKA